MLRGIYLDSHHSCISLGLYLQLVFIEVLQHLCR